MSIDFTNKLVVAMSSRALFNLEDSNKLWEELGEIEYAKYQIANEDKVLEPGPAYWLAKKLLNLRQADCEEPLVEIILASRNSADTGLRVFNSIKAHNLNITRAAFTRGQPPYTYVAAFGAHLFLSAHNEDVVKALNAGCAAATIFPNNPINQSNGLQLRMAFDGDAVIFSDEAEKVFQEKDLSAFQASEQASAKLPLAGGPFKNFLEVLHQLQGTFSPQNCPIRTALITARNAPAHERAIRTLRAWNIRTDEALFLGGMDKAKFLVAFGADIFFDDQTGHCQSANQYVATGHVPHGISNNKKARDI